MKRKADISRIITSILLSGLFLLTAGGVSLSKTLTNKDIYHLQGTQNKGVPTYKGKNSPSAKSPATGAPSSGVPSVPSLGSSPGVPVIPGPLGVTAGALKTAPGKGAAVVKKHLPFGEWTEEYEAYFKKHYNDGSLELKPKLIVLHYSGTPTFERLWWTFVKGGNEGHLSVHYVVDKDGAIYELMPPNRRARGTYGVNHVAISIDLVGMNQSELLKNQRQMQVSFALVRYLMKYYKIPQEKVRAHYEVAKGKEIVPEYLDYADSRYPDSYPPGSAGRGPGKAYMFKLRYYLNEK